MEGTIDTLASFQECELSLCKVVDEACGQADINGLTGALGQTASETDTAQFSQLLGLEKNDICLS